MRASLLRLVRNRNVTNRTATHQNQIRIDEGIFSVSPTTKKNTPICLPLAVLWRDSATPLSKIHLQNLSFPSPLFSFFLRKKPCYASIHLLVHVNPSRIAQNFPARPSFPADKRDTSTPPFIPPKQQQESFLRRDRSVSNTPTPFGKLIALTASAPNRHPRPLGPQEQTFRSISRLIESA